MPPQGCTFARAAEVNWSKELPFVLLSLRAQPREDTCLSPADSEAHEVGGVADCRCGLQRE
jgi:hypothetical protein